MSKKGELHVAKVFQKDSDSYKAFEKFEKSNFFENNLYYPLTAEKLTPVQIYNICKQIFGEAFEAGKSETKTFKEAFVIVKRYEGQHEYFQDHISFNKEELEKKCEELNEKENAKFEKAYKKNKKNKLPFSPIVINSVVPLQEAIDTFRDIVADTYTDHDASY